MFFIPSLEGITVRYLHVFKYLYRTKRLSWKWDWCVRDFWNNFTHTIYGILSSEMSSCVVIFRQNCLIGWGSQNWLEHIQSNLKFGRDSSHHISRSKEWWEGEAQKRGGVSKIYSNLVILNSGISRFFANPPFVVKVILF